MNCFVCKGNIEDKPTNFMVDLGNSIIIVKKVPSSVCTQCGEVSYSDNTARNLEKIVEEVRDTKAEITVIPYNKSHQLA